MGYTHYWYRKPSPADRQTYQALGSDIKRIIAEAERQSIIINGPGGFGSPEMNEQYISFNGDSDAQLDHESFVWRAEAIQSEWEKRMEGESNETFTFCKTAYKPYDAVVTAVLIRAKELYGDAVRVVSDGSWAEWADGRALYEQVFGTEPTCPFTSEGVSI